MNLTPRAKMIYDDVVGKLQAADELGGCDTICEYVDLMTAISEEVLERRTNAIIWNA